MEVLNLASTQDKWTNALTLGPLGSGLQLVGVAANNSVDVAMAARVKSGTLQPIDYDRYLTFPPGPLDIQNVGGVAFRSTVPGSPAVISCALLEPGDPVPAFGSEFVGLLTASGQYNPPSTTTIDRVTTLPANPADKAAIVLDLSGTQAGTEWLCFFNASTGFWDVIGAVPLESYTAQGGPNDYRAATGFGPLVSGTAPQIVLPHAGSYLVEADGFCVVGGIGAGLSVTGEMALTLNGSGPSNTFGVSGIAGVTTNNAAQTIAQMHAYTVGPTALPANAAISVCYESTQTNTNEVYYYSKLRITPVRISP